MTAEKLAHSFLEHANYLAALGYEFDHDADLLMELLTQTAFPTSKE